MIYHSTQSDNYLGYLILRGKLKEKKHTRLQNYPELYGLQLKTQKN